MRELDTIGRLMDAFRSSVHALNRHREQLAAQVKARTAELQELVIEHRQARAEAEKASRAKSAFLAAMSHEIRTPLYGILGTAQLLADNPALNAQRDDLRAITDSGESLLTILNDILDYSAIEAGGKNVSVSDEPFEPRPLLESTLQLMSGRVKGRPIRGNRNCRRCTDCVNGRSAAYSSGHYQPVEQRPAFHRRRAHYPA